MDYSTLLLFAITVLPLVCTPGPDLLFVAAQALTGGRRGALRANAGVILGYLAHALLCAMGLAAVVAASPVLFEALRWIGIAYMAYLAVQMFRSATRPSTGQAQASQREVSIFRGFLTSFLNPKGLLVYLAILPAFMHAGEPVAPQAIALSAVFVGLCALVYGAVGLTAATVGRRGASNDRFRRIAEFFAGAMLFFAAVRINAR